MPCLNESETIASCINKANQWRIDSGLMECSEVLIADSRYEKSYLEKVFIYNPNID